MNNKLLVLCGPTATGKTDIAIKLAQKFNGELISADSRQVYQGMDIGTGKDKVPGLTIWGYDIADPKIEFSVSDYQKFARIKINEIWQQNKLPILVGGTGFYIQAVIDGVDSINVPRDEALRNELMQKDTNQLQQLLKEIDSQKYGSLNNSDRNNPTRLIRSIEVAKSQIKAQDTALLANILMIGLFAERDILNQRIRDRVKKRISQGFNQEVKNLLADGITWQHQSMRALGYRQWKSFIEGKVEEDFAIEKWILEEQKYAKRQMTWFKKDTRIIWFDANKPNILLEVEKHVKSWHNSNKSNA